MVLENLDFETAYQPFAELVEDGTILRTQISDRRSELRIWYEGESSRVIRSVSAVEAALLERVDELEGPLTFSYELDEEECRLDVGMHDVWFSSEVTVVGKFDIPDALHGREVSYDDLYHDAVTPKGFDAFSPAGDGATHPLTEWNARSFEVGVEEGYNTSWVNPDETIDVDDGEKTLRVDVALDVWGVTTADDLDTFVRDSVTKPLSIEPSNISTTTQTCGLFSRSKGQLGNGAARINVSGLGGVLFQNNSVKSDEGEDSDGDE